MRIYRICPRRFLEDFAGRGKTFGGGGRWNPPGMAALYFGESPGVAMLEIAHYFSSPRAILADFRLGIYEVDAGAVVERWAVDDLPADWRAAPYPASTQERGGEWLASARADFLVLPSVAVPGGLENIVVFNPKRSGGGIIKLVKTESEIFASRAFALT